MHIQMTEPIFGHDEPSKVAKSGPRPTKQKKPNYKSLHADPLPLRIHPLPPLVPHNPFSLLHIAYTYISYLIFSSRSHPPIKHQGWLSLETRSVHIIDEGASRTLWEKGFFGKGSLSRSEPSWLDREKRRKGIRAVETSEEVTKKRREERREFKKERARKEREAIEEKLREEAESRTNGNIATVPDPAPNHTKDQIVHSVNIESRDFITPAQPTLVHEGVEVEKSNDNEAKQLDEEQSLIPSPDVVHVKNELSLDHIQNQEHLQLSFEEALFLVYGLGVLVIIDQDTHESISTDLLFTLFRQYSYFPQCVKEALQPDDPFLISYIVYHHFRSLGWVVRSGIKFAVDYLLYNRGPVFSHAEFALMIIPSYAHPYWNTTEELAMKTREKESRSWWWLHCVNRVQSQVRKSLVLVYVEVPPPLDAMNTLLNKSPAKKAEGAVNISQLLRRYKVRELILKRWIPNRSRD